MNCCSRDPACIHPGALRADHPRGLPRWLILTMSLRVILSSLGSGPVPLYDGISGVRDGASGQAGSQVLEHFVWSAPTAPAPATERYAKHGHTRPIAFAGLSLRRGGFVWPWSVFAVSASFLLTRPLSRFGLRVLDSGLFSLHSSRDTLHFFRPRAQSPRD